MRYILFFLTVDVLNILWPWVLQVFSSRSEQALLFMAVPGLLIEVASLAAEFMLFRVLAQKLGHMGLVAPRHVESSCTRDQIHVPCIGRRILIHFTTRELPVQYILKSELIQNYIEQNIKLMCKISKF